jgi:hypothetical protein
MSIIVCPHCQFSKKIAFEKLPKGPAKIKCPVCNLNFPFNVNTPSPDQKNPYKQINSSTSDSSRLVPARKISCKASFLIIFVLLLIAAGYVVFNNHSLPKDPVTKSAAPKEKVNENTKEKEKVSVNVDLYPIVATSSEWGQHLNPEALAPNNLFKVFYINIKTPDKVVATDFSKSASVNYIYNQLHGIPSEDFGAYWVGNFEFKAETKRAITVAQSHAETKIYIDGENVFGQSNKKGFLYTFTKGLHTIEVEHINHWHTTDLMVNILPPVPLSTSTEAMVAIEDVVRQGAVKYWFASVYESNRMDHQIEIDLQQSDTPVILFLSSYGPVNWVINDTDETQLKTILYSSYKQGSQITIDSAIPTLKLKWDHLSYATTLVPDCREAGNRMHCEGEKDFPRLTKQIDRLTLGKKLDGFTGIYDDDVISVPKVILDAAKYKNIQDQRDAIERRKKQLANRSIDNLYK